MSCTSSCVSTTPSGLRDQGENSEKNPRGPSQRTTTNKLNSGLIGRTAAAAAAAAAAAVHVHREPANKRLAALLLLLLGWRRHPPKPTYICLCASCGSKDIGTSHPGSGIYKSRDTFTAPATRRLQKTTFNTTGVKNNRYRPGD